MPTNRMIMRSMKFRAMIDAIGRAEDMMVLSTSAMRSSLLFLYRIIGLLPAASPGISSCKMQRQTSIHRSTYLCLFHSDAGRQCLNGKLSREKCLNSLPCSVCRSAYGNDPATSLGTVLKANLCWLPCQNQVWRSSRACSYHPKHAFRDRRETSCRMKNDLASAVASLNYMMKGAPASLSLLVE